MSMGVAVSLSVCASGYIKENSAEKSTDSIKYIGLNFYISKMLAKASVKHSQ
jgi:hypothetical protein